MDDLAAHLGVDPLEIREKNWIKNDEFPFTTVAGLQYDTGNYEVATAKAKEVFGYDALRAEQKERRERGDRVQLGIGVSTYTEMCGLAPSRILGQLSYGAGGWEHAEIRMLATGKVEVVIGVSPHGQGHETAFSQIVADRLGVPFEDVEVLHGDTQVVRPGPGHLRLPVARARRRGGRQGRRQGDREGQGRRGAPDGGQRRRRPVRQRPLHASPAPTRAWASRRSRWRRSPRTTSRTGFETNLDSEATFDAVTFSFPHGTHLCAMEVDTETGRVKMRKYVCVDDIGTVINPLIANGQVHGGVTQGIAQALWEEAVYDDAGTLVSGSFVDYLLPTAADVDQLRRRPHAQPVDDELARHQGRRRDRHHRLDAGGRERRRGRRTTPRGDRHRDADDAGARLDRPPGRSGRRRDRRGRRAALRGAGGQTDDPRTVRLPVARPRSRRPSRRWPSFGDDAKIIAGGQSLLPVLRMRLNAPEVVVDLGKIDSLRGIRDDGDAIVIGAMTTHHDVMQRRAGPRARPADHQGGDRGGRRADPAPGHVRRRSRARRPRRRPRCAGAGARRGVRDRRPGGTRTVGGRRLLRRPLRDRDRRGRDPHRGPHPQAHRLGRALREVRAGRPPVADRRGRGDGRGSTAAPSRRPASG